MTHRVEPGVTQGLFAQGVAQGVAQRVAVSSLTSLKGRFSETKTKEMKEVPSEIKIK